MLKLYHGLPALLHTLWQLLAQRALHFQWAIAPTAPGARVCCLYQSGLSFTTFTAYRQQLESIPLSLLQLPSDLTTALQRLGLRTIGQWLALPGASLSRRFPKQLAELKAMLLGERLWPLNYLLPVVHFSEQLELLWQVEQQQYLHKPLQLLLKRLQQFLLTTDQLCYQTQLVLHIRDLPAMRLTLQSPQALSQAEHWLRLWQQKLSQLPLTGPVCMLTLSAENYCPQQAITADLYSKVQGDCPPLQLLGLLQARLGESQVRQPAFHPQWQHCYHAQDSSPATTTSSATAFASSTESLPASLQSPHTPPRPAFIFATPQPLPTPVEFLPGLERVHAQWWQSSQPLQLDLRHAQSSDGRYLWLCRQPGKDWHWLGVFA